MTLATNGATINPSVAWNGTKEVWTGAYVAPENMVSDNNIIPFTLDYRDIFTVPGAQVSESVLDPNTGNVVSDNDAPALTLFTATSDNDNNKKAKVGDAATVIIKGDERLAKTADPSVEAILSN